MLTGLALAVLYGLLGYLSFRVTYQRLFNATVGGIFVSMPVVAGSQLWLPGNTVIGAVCCVFALFVTITLVVRQIEIRRWRRRAGFLMVLDPPVTGIWMVAAGGPFAHGNPHTAVPAQRFAYDLVRDDDESLGSPIIAPIGGVIEHVRDTMQDGKFTEWGSDRQNVPLVYGNMVSIRHRAVRVVLCHLREGSIPVKIGDMISAGATIGLCGHSGRSLRPHLHIHAQDSPANRRGDGVPIAFNMKGERWVPMPGDMLS